MDNSTTQDLNQGITYVSSRGEVDVRTMVTVHARRSLEKLVRENGWSIVSTELGKALVARAALDGHIPTQTDVISGEGRMLRDPVTGHWSGKWVK
jgi:hypothetical protein